MSTAFPLLSNPAKHFYTTRNGGTQVIVLHVTAGLQDLDMAGADQSAEGTNRYGATTDRPASWHTCVDSDTIAPALPDTYTAFHCKGYNSRSLGLEISNADARWDNKPRGWTAATLKNAAKVCWEWEKKYGIPRRLLTKAQVDSGAKGYTFHSFLDPARRRDPGTTFPWDQFTSYLAALDGAPTTTDAPTPGGGDMSYLVVKDGIHWHTWDGYNDPLWIRNPGVLGNIHAAKAKNPGAFVVLEFTSAEFDQWITDMHAGRSDWPNVYRLQADHVWRGHQIPKTSGGGQDIGPAGAGDYLRHIASHATNAGVGVGQIAGLAAAVQSLAALVGKAEGADAAEIEAAVAKAIRENTVKVDVTVAKGI